MGLSLREDSLGAWFSVGLRPESQKVVATKGFWVLCVDVFRESLEWGSGAEQKKRRLGIPVGPVCSPWLVVSLLRHGSLSNSLPLSFW